jgi:hypothetical protein
MWLNFTESKMTIMPSIAQDVAVVMLSPSTVRRTLRTPVGDGMGQWSPRHSLRPYIAMPMIRHIVVTVLCATVRFSFSATASIASKGKP